MGAPSCWTSIVSRQTCLLAPRVAHLGDKSPHCTSQWCPRQPGWGLRRHSGKPAPVSAWRAQGSALGHHWYRQGETQSVYPVPDRGPPTYPGHPREKNNFGARLADFCRSHCRGCSSFCGRPASRSPGCDRFGAAGRVPSHARHLAWCLHGRAYPGACHGAVWGRDWSV